MKEFKKSAKKAVPGNKVFEIQNPFIKKERIDNKFFDFENSNNETSFTVTIDQANHKDDNKRKSEGHQADDEQETFKDSEISLA